MPKAFGWFEELKRRNVLRAAALYIGAVWAFGQGLSQFSPALGLPDYTTRWFLIAAAIGFPFWLAFAWFYAFTPQGLKRESQVASNPAIAHSAARKLDFAIIGVLVVAVVLLASGYFFRRGAPATAPTKSIAVLPFENLSGDKSNAYFADGMQDLILTKLADIGDLKVISRTSTEKYKSRPDDLRTIGQQLGVATVLEGSVQKAGNEVLINVQLINARTDSHIWAQSYTRTLDNVFGVEGEVAGKIAAALQAKLSPAKVAQLAAVPTTNPAAYDAFLRAEALSHQGGRENMKAAIALYLQAAQADPGFARAWARRSIAESNLADAGFAGEDAAALNRQARADADQALQLQPQLPDAQLAIGYCDYLGRRDYASAVKAFAAVLAQRPNDVEALVSQAYAWRDQGRFDPAIASLTKAVVLDPRNFTTTFELGSTYMAASRYKDAETWFRRALVLEPDSLDAKSSYASTILYSSGDVPRALAVLQGDSDGAKFARAWIEIYQRKYADLIALLENIKVSPGDEELGYSKTIQLAVAYHLAGNEAKARTYFAAGLVRDQALLPKALGLNRAALLNTIGGEEIGSGHMAAGLATIAQAEAILDESPDAMFGPRIRRDDAGVYAMAHRPDLAVPVLAKALTEPGIGANYSPVMLWLDPYWDPIRHDPGFEALQQEYAKWKPTVIPAPPVSDSKP